MKTRNHAICRMLAVALSFGGACGVRAATLPVQEGFEGHADGTPLSSLSGTGWGGSSAEVKVVTVTNVADAVRGTNALSVGVGAAATNVVVSSAPLSNVWVDVYTHVSAGMEAGLVSTSSVDTNVTAQLFLDTNGCPVVWRQASNAWLVCTQDFRGTSVLTFTSQWERLTLCHNYSNKTVALFMNEHLLLSGLQFNNTNRSSYERFLAESGQSYTSYVDEVYMGYAPPAQWTLDLDDDGMTEAQEIQLCGNVTNRHRPFIGVTVSGPGNVATNGYGVGIVTNGGGFDVRPGATNTFWLSASNGYYVAVARTNGFSVGGILSGQYTSNALCTWTNIMPDGLANGSFEAVFLAKPNLTVAAVATGTGPSSTGGVATLSASELFPVNDHVTCSLTADVAYAAAEVRTNGVLAATFGGQPRTASYTISNVWADMTVTGVFNYTATRYVPGDHSTLQAAVSAALTNETIVVAANVYSNNVTLDKNLALIATNVTLNGSLAVAAGATGTLAGCVGLAVTGGVSVAGGGVLMVSGGSIDLGVLTVQDGGTVQVVNATALVADGATFTGTFKLVHGWETNVIAQMPPYADPFERYAAGTRMNRMGYFGWAANSDGVVAQASQAQSGRAVVLPARTTLSGTMASPASTNVWVEFYCHDTNRVPVGEATLGHVDTNAAVAAFIDENGYVTVFNPEQGAGQWDVCSNDVLGAAVGSLANSAWARISINMNYQQRRAAVFLDGRLLRQELRFINTNLANAGRFQVEAGYVGAVHVDTYSTWTNSAGIVSDDRDLDGWIDAWEIDQIGNISVNPPRGVVFKIR